MATIVWTDPQGVVHRSHTLDPAGTRQEIIEQHGGRVVDVEKPQEAKPRITYHRDPSGHVVSVTEESTVIGEEPEPTPEPEEKEEVERKPYGGPPLPPIDYQRYKDIQPALRPAPPLPEPGMYVRPGVTATPEQLVTLPLPRKGIAEGVVPPMPEALEPVDKPYKRERAEELARRRIVGEREEFEEEYQPLTQDIIQSRYDKLMGEKARSLGMMRDPVTGSWMYTSSSQLEAFTVYQPIAQQLALEQGTSFYETQWEQFDIGERAESIYREEYGEEGFVLVETDEGEYTVVPKKERKRQLAVEAERERIRERMTGTPEERIMEYTRFVSLSLLKPVSFLAPIGGEILFGGEKAKERILDIYAGKTTELKGKGIPDVFVSSYIDPGGLGFIGTVFAVAPKAIGLLGKIGGPGGAIIKVGVPTVLKGAIVTTVGFDIGITAAKEKPYDPSKGIEQFGALVTGEAAKKVVQYGAFFGLAAGFGYAATRPYTLLEPKYKPVHGVLETPVGKKFEVVGVKKYGELFGREVFGKYRFLAGREYQYPLRGYKPPLGISEGKLPYRTGKPITTDLSKAVVSLTQIKGVQKITYDVSTGMFAVEKIVTKMKPFDTKFKPPSPTVRTPEEILFETKLDVDLFKKMEPKFVQKKITDVVKGKFLIGEDTVKLEKTPFLVGTKPIGKPVKPEPRPMVDLKKWEVTKADIKKYDAIQEDASEKLRMFHTQKVVGLKDLFKLPPIQKKLVEEFRVVVREGKPVVRKLMPEPKTIVDIERLNKLQELKMKSLVKTTQTSLDRLFKMPSYEIVKGVLVKQPPSKPFRLKPIKEEKIIESKTDTTVTLLKKIDVKTSVRDLDIEFISKKPSGITEETLRRLGRFDTDEYVRMAHPEAPKGVVKPADRLDLFVAPIVGRISKTEISQVKVVGELSGRLMQIGKVSIFEKIVSDITDVRQRSELKTSQGILQVSLNIQDVVSGKRQVQIQMQTQLQMQRQALRTEMMLTSTTKTIFEKPSVTITPPAILGFEAGLMSGVSLYPQAYDAYTYKTQFQNGRRIRGKEEVKINKKPLRRMDAFAVGSDVVDNTAKRTIILKPAEGKPHKPRKKVPSWSSQMFEYNDKGNDVFVEKNRHAIDSPGELKEITMKGIAARKRGGKRRKTGVPRDFSNVGVKMDRELNRIGRRMII